MEQSKMFVLAEFVGT